MAWSRVVAAVALVLAAGRARAQAEPAGDWFLPYYSTCPRCAPPTVALLLGVYPDEAAATAAVATAARAALPLGYPLALHTDELRLENMRKQGIAVVVGLYAREDEARVDRARLAAALPSLTMARVLPASERRFTPGTRFVVQIAAGAPVPAWDSAAVDVHRLGAEPRGEPLCRIAPGALFVADADAAGVYAWAPVRCGGRAALVRWRDTLLTSAILPLPDGSHHLVQVKSVLCDEPAFAEWRYDARGRHALGPRDPRLAPREKGCRE